MHKLIAYIYPATVTRRSVPSTVKQQTTGQLVRVLGDEFVPFDDKTRILAELRRRDKFVSP